MRAATRCLWRPEHWHSGWLQVSCSRRQTHMKHAKKENKIAELIQLNGAQMAAPQLRPAYVRFFCLVFSFFSFFFPPFCQVLAVSLEGSSILAMSSTPLSFRSPMESPYRCMNGAFMLTLVLANIISIGPHSYVTIGWNNCLSLGPRENPFCKLHCVIIARSKLDARIKQFGSNSKSRSLRIDRHYTTLLTSMHNIIQQLVSVPLPNIATTN